MEAPRIGIQRLVRCALVTIFGLVLVVFDLTHASLGPKPLNLNEESAD